MIGARLQTGTFFRNTHNLGPSSTVYGSTGSANSGWMSQIGQPQSSVSTFEQRCMDYWQITSGTYSNESEADRNDKAKIICNAIDRQKLGMEILGCTAKQWLTRFKNRKLTVTPRRRKLVVPELRLLPVDRW